MSEKATQLDVEYKEANFRLRESFNHINDAIVSLERIDAIHSGSAETALSRRRLQEARFWLIEHGHGSWVES